MNILNIIEIFNSNAWLNIIFLITTLLSIFLAIYFYYKAKKEKKPVYNIRTFILLQKPTISKNNSLKIKYNNKIINKLSLTKIAFWNSGRETIKKQDISSKDPLLIQILGDNIIYDYEIEYKNDVNNFIVTKPNNKSISIEFDFVDFNDGLVLNIYHSAINNADFAIKGTIIGANKLSNGIKKDKIMNLIGFIFEPFDYFFKSKNKLKQLLGGVLVVPIAFILFPVMLFIISPLNYIYNKTLEISNKKFYF